MVGGAIDTGGLGLLERLIGFSARNWLLVLMRVIASAAWGYRSLVNAPLDAIPDLSDVQVIVFTEWPGRSPDLVEDQITYPLTSTLLSAPDVRFVRGQSFMGLSFVYVIFEDGTDMYWARSRNAQTPGWRTSNTGARCNRRWLGVSVCAGRQKRQP